MGIKGAWETFEHAAIVEPLTELCLRNGGFSDLSNNSPEYVLGVDANNVLSRALSPVLGERGLARRHWAREARSSDLIGAITSLAGYFNSPCTVVFVFDGPLKSDMKRDKAIVPRDPRVIKNYKRLLNVLGFNIWEALGEADADLGIMSKFGLANSVLSDDSDLFVLGARTVLRTEPLMQGDTGTRRAADAPAQVPGRGARSDAHAPLTALAQDARRGVPRGGALVKGIPISIMVVEEVFESPLRSPGQEQSAGSPGRSDAPAAPSRAPASCVIRAVGRDMGNLAAEYFSKPSF
ncbi:PIN domain-like protein [Schizophyllum amplum]|uniref:PIN domain-like protein n=1 Tax=Schizophyllum amplum TaxID=97359 RepID=A0A550C842_9AGAR|nr:PIN domain-like protein [Auriculariopsis ampla]